MPTPVFRFAPSPNGYLHVGHALSALLNFELARRCDGRLLLRIEDIDATRCRPEYEAAIYEDLAWLGLARGQPGGRRTAPLHSSSGGAGPGPRTRVGVPLCRGGPRARAVAARAGRIEAGHPYALRLDMAAAARR